jgi:hypothetical protein
MADAFAFLLAMEAKLRTEGVDGVIAILARHQHGVVARWQLLEIGIGRRAIGHRLKCGRLHRVHQGVYAVGHTALSPAGRRMAAVLAHGRGAVASHRCAGAAWRLLQSERLEATVASRGHARPRIQRHFACLPADEVTVLDAIPVTTVPRTIFDCGAVLRPSRVEQMLKQADILRLTDPLSLHDLLDRYPRRRGAPVIRAILGVRDIGLGVTRDELEARFQEFIHDYGLPRPELNVWLTVGDRTFQVDCLWREPGLIVELDGRETHHTIAAFESDRVRDRVLSVAADWRVIRVTWRQLHEEPAALAADLQTLLMRRAGLEPATPSLSSWCSPN